MSIAALNVLIEQDINASSAFRLMRVIKELSSIVDDKLKMEKKIYDKWVEKMRMVLLLFRWTRWLIEGVSITDVASFTKEMEELMNFENEGKL
jgi:hypothetical protein